MEVQAFREAGVLTLPTLSLNDAPAWLDALAAVATQHMRGWPPRHDDTSPEARAGQREAAWPWARATSPGLARSSSPCQSRM